MPEIKDVEVSDDHLILSAILDESNLTVKWLSQATGRSAAQCYRYLSGEATIPTHIWRVVYEKTRDVRIPPLFFGNVPVSCIDLTCDFSNGIPSLRTLLAMRKGQLDYEQSILKILEDGKIDEKDRAEVDRMMKDFSVMIRTQAQIHFAIIHQLERSRR